MNLALVLTSAIVLFLSAVFILVFKKSTRTSSRKLPPGPIIWPLIGNLFEIKAADRVYPHVALAKLAKKYGNIMGIGFGSTYTVVISGYEEMKELFKRTELTMYRFGFPYATERSFNKHLGILWNGGEDWKEVRRFTMRTLIDFGFGKTKRLELAMKEELDVVLKEIRVSARSNDGVWFVDTHALATFAINVLWLLVGRCRFERGDEIIRENLRLSDRVAKIMSFDNIDNVFPGLKKWVPWIVPQEAHMQVHRAFQAWAKNLIDETKQKRVRRVDTEAQNFIEVFIDEIERNRGKESPFTEEQLIVVLLDLFLAGSETTSMTLNWAILFLTLNPECQSKLREEIKEAKERLGEITIQEADKLTYLNAVLLEVSRMGIVVPMAIRKASEDTSFNGILIPKVESMI